MEMIKNASHDLFTRGRTLCLGAQNAYNNAVQNPNIRQVVNQVVKQTSDTLWTHKRELAAVAVGYIVLPMLKNWLVYTTLTVATVLVTHRIVAEKMKSKELIIEPIHDGKKE